MIRTDAGRAAAQARQEMESLLTDIVVTPTVRELKPLISPLASASAVGAIDVRTADIQRTLRSLGEVAEVVGALHTETFGPEGEPSLREEVQQVEAGIAALPSRRDVSGVVDGAAERVLAVLRPVADDVARLPSAVHELKTEVGELPGGIDAVRARVEALADGLPELRTRIEVSVSAASAEASRTVERVRSDLEHAEDRLSALVTTRTDALFAQLTELATRATTVDAQLRSFEDRFVKSEAEHARRLAESVALEARVRGAEAESARRRAETEALDTRVRETEAENTRRVTETGALDTRVGAVEADNALRRADAVALEARVGEVEVANARRCAEDAKLRSEVEDWRTALTAERRAASRRLSIWMGVSTVAWVLLALYGLLSR